MKRNGAQGHDSGRKKLAGDFLKNADRYLKAGEFDAAMVEVERTLDIDPGNFYAHAYKERIVTLRQKKHKEQEEAAVALAELARDGQLTISSADSAGDSSPQNDELSEKIPHSSRSSAREGKLTQDEIRRKFLADKARQDEATRQQALESRQRAEEELRRRAQEVEILRQQEESEKRTQQQVRETEQQRAEAESRKHREEEENRRQAAEEERKRLEAEARRKVEEIARQKLEEELRRRMEEEQLRKAREEELRKEEEESRRKAQLQLVQEHLDAANAFMKKNRPKEAFAEVLKVRSLQPDNPEANKIEEHIRQQELAQQKAQLDEVRQVPRTQVLETYYRTLLVAFSDGIPSQTQQALVSQMRKSLNITSEEHNSIEPKAKLAAYRGILQTALASSDSKDVQDEAERIRQELNISEGDAKKIRSELTVGS